MSPPLHYEDHGTAAGAVSFGLCMVVRGERTSQTRRLVVRSRSGGHAFSLQLSALLAATSPCVEMGILFLLRAWRYGGCVVCRVYKDYCYSTRPRRLKPHTRRKQSEQKLELDKDRGRGRGRQIIELDVLLLAVCLKVNSTLPAFFLGHHDRFKARHLPFTVSNQRHGKQVRIQHRHIKHIR
jgi:hypothetical protein